jgi:hypothetical protein
MRGAGGGERLRRARGRRLARSHWRRRTRRSARMRSRAAGGAGSGGRADARTRDSATRAGHRPRWYDLSEGVAGGSGWERIKSQPRCGRRADAR